MRKHIAIIIASLALFTGQAHAQRCLPKMQGIELRANLVDGMRLFLTRSKKETAVFGRLWSLPL